MRISYIFELLDHQAVDRAARHNARMKAHNLKWACSPLLGAVLVSCAVPVSIAMTWWTKAIGLYLIEPFSMVLGVALFFCTFIGLSYATAKPRLRSCFELTKSAGKRVTFELSESGIACETDTSRGMSDWSDIVCCVEQPAHMLLFVGPVEAYVFPRRAFASDMDFTAAVTFAKERVRGQAL